MSDLIKLKTEAGDVVFINLNHVISIEKNSSANGVSTIYMSNGRYFNASISIEDVESRFPRGYSFC